MRHNPARPRIALCLPAFAGLLAAAPLSAHPHEFVEARLTFVADDTGAIARVGVEWRYDAFTSMLILGDLGLNPAAETLTEDERAQLSGFDTNWAPDYNGDLWPFAGNAPVTLGPPEEPSARLEDGQIVSQHWRAMTEPVDPAARDLSVLVYDPEFYISYSIDHESAVEGRPDCRVRFFGPDLQAAEDRLQAALEELMAGGETDLETNFPAVGRDFAEEARLDCAAPAD